MKIRENSISKEIVIETTLRLIEENKGIKDVNLRGIAKEIGCAHTNLYNYFDSLDEILWESLGEIILKMIDFVDTNLVTEADYEDKFYLILLSILDFSMQHPGWYRLLWLETLGGSPSPRVIQILQKPTLGFNEVLIKASNDSISEDKANQIGNILYSYLHGELCKWLNNRNFETNHNETKMRIYLNLKYLYKLLMSKGDVHIGENDYFI